MSFYVRTVVEVCYIHQTQYLSLQFGAMTFYYVHKCTHCSLVVPVLILFILIFCLLFSFQVKPKDPVQQGMLRVNSITLHFSNSMYLIASTRPLPADEYADPKKVREKKDKEEKVVQLAAD